MNARILEEAKEIEARWAANGLLNKIYNPFDRQGTAILLESQRLYNEKMSGQLSNRKNIDK